MYMCRHEIGLHWLLPVSAFNRKWPLESNSEWSLLPFSYLCRIWSRSLCKTRKTTMVSVTEKNRSKRHQSALRPPFSQSFKSSSASHRSDSHCQIGFHFHQPHPWGGLVQVGRIIQACYLTRHPAKQSPSSYSTTQQLESHFSQGSNPPTLYQALSDPTVSLHCAPPLCVWGDFLTKRRPLRHTWVRVYRRGTFSFFSQSHCSWVQLIGLFERCQGHTGFFFSSVCFISARIKHSDVVC